jgi:hypothetical protein
MIQRCQLRHFHVKHRAHGLTSRQDYPYLSPIIEEIEAEASEREDLESMIIKKKTSAARASGSASQIESKH